MSQFHALAQRAFALLLQRQVERQSQRVARARLDLRQAGRLHLVFGVDLHLLRPGLAAQVAVVLILEALLADDRSRLDATEVGVLGVARFLLFLGDLADVAEHLRGHVVVGVVAHRDFFLLDAWELILTLGQHRQRAATGVGLDRHGGVGQFADPLLLDFTDRARAHFKLLAQAPVERPATRPFRGQFPGDELHRVGDLARHQHVAFAVDDLPAGCGDRQFAQRVLGGLLDVLFAGQDLQVPEAEEDDSEHHERNAAQHRHAQAELGGDRRRRAWLWRADTLEWGHAFDRGLNPPVV